MLLSPNTQVMKQKYGPEPPLAPGNQTAPPSQDISQNAAANAETKARLIRFYENYDPSKVSNVDSALEKFKGRENDMWIMLVNKYGPEPGQTKATASAAPRDNSGIKLELPDTHHKERLTAYYQQYDPSKLDRVDAALVKYAGKEGEMWSTLIQKYGPEPGQDEKIKLLEYFGRKDPAQVANIHVIVTAYVNNYGEMWKNLKTRYGE
jgi:hypothetical protein